MQESRQHLAGCIDVGVGFQEQSDGVFTWCVYKCMMHGSVTFLTTPTTIMYTEAIAQVDGVGCDHAISQHSKILVLICAIIGIVYQV